MSKEDLVGKYLNPKNANIEAGKKKYKTQDPEAVGQKPLEDGELDSQGWEKNSRFLKAMNGKKNPGRGLTKD